MVVDKVSNRVIEILGEIIEENIDNFRDANKSEDNDYDSFEVSPGYGNNLFYLEKIDGSYYQSLYGLIHYIMYEEGLYKNFLDNEWYSVYPVSTMWTI